MRRSVATAAVVAVLLAGCGGGSETPVAQPTQPTATTTATSATLPSIDAPAGTSAPRPTTPDAPRRPPPPSPTSLPSTGASVLPDLAVDDIGAGTKVNLTSLVPAAQPLLLWLWAPH